jgi:hypothetical protein
MTTLSVELKEVFVLHVSITDDTFSVDLSDGRTIAVPLAWFPRLVHATQSERANCQLVGKGAGIHWPDLDEDISVENLVLGNPSGESQASFQRWLDSREKLIS